jgi:hypothetical protein
MQYLSYYSYPCYWGGVSLWGGGAYPGEMLANVGYGGCYADYLEGQPDNAGLDADPHLRSTRALMKYHIRATDGDIGHVSGLLFDEETWAVRYLIVDTNSWWPGHQVLIAPQWIRDVRWADESVAVSLTQQAVKNAPPYDSSKILSREHEVQLHRYHGHTGYWADEVRLKNPDSRAPSRGAAQVRNR